MASNQHMTQLFDVLMRLDDMFPKNAPSSEKVAYNALFKYSGTTRFASGRNSDYTYIKNCINRWKECKIAVVNDKGMGVAIYGRNGFSYTGSTTKSLRDKIDQINGDNGNIIDVSLSSDGGVAIVFDSYGWHTNNAPERLSDRLHHYNLERENILSASFNSLNEYCIVADKHYDTSGGRISEFVKTAQSRYGAIDYAYISDLGRVAICRRGIHYENIPSNVVEALGVIKFKPDYIKFTDSGYYCISNKNGYSRYLL